MSAARIARGMGLAALAVAGLGLAVSCADIANIREAVPTCEDGKRDNGEDGVDCGGPCIGKCPGDACTIGNDCASGVCPAPMHKCLEPRCTDKVWNGQETDVDCGGADCPACVDTNRCKAGCDCVSGDCSGGECQPANGINKRCGGAMSCAQCADGHPCNVNLECLSNTCQVDGTCGPTPAPPP